MLIYKSFLQYELLPRESNPSKVLSPRFQSLQVALKKLWEHLGLPQKSCDCVKSVGIRSYSGAHTHEFGLNTKYISVFSTYAGKYGPE